MLIGEVQHERDASLRAYLRREPLQQRERLVERRHGGGDLYSLEPSPVTRVDRFAVSGFLIVFTPKPMTFVWVSITPRRSCTLGKQSCTSGKNGPDA